MKIAFLKKAYGLAALLGLGFVASQAQAAVCTYDITSQWNTGFIGSITIKNDTTAVINDWSVNWQYSKNTLVNHFNADLTGNNPYTANALAWNKVIQPGASVSFGFQGSNNGGAPESPVVKGAVCSTVIGSSSSSSAPSTSSSSSSKSTSSSSSSALGCNQQQCNWYGTGYPVCETTSSGWGYENGKSCIAASTCRAQPAPYGLFLSPGCPSSSVPRSSTSSSRSSSTIPVDYYCNGHYQFTPCSSGSSSSRSSSSSSSLSSINWEYRCNGVLQHTPCSSSSSSKSSNSSSSIRYEYFCSNGVIQYTPCSSSSRSSSSSSIIIEPPMNNPFTGATWYINPIWKAKAMSEPGGSAIANNNTAVWLDRIATVAPVDGSFGLAEHLDAALAQNANLITLVIYDLPNRDCKALASNGELKISENGFSRYKNEYITPIVNILSQAKYRNLRIIAIIEPDSLPNLVTNLANPKCQEAAGAGGYVEATQFTLNQLYPLSNVYSYLDIGHSGWLGWPDNLAAATTFIANAVKGTSHGVNSIRGFVSNTAGYTPNTEPFLDSLSNSALPGSNGGTQVRQARFYEWNPYFSEIAYVQAWREQMIIKGFPSTIGMLIDTSRNGWGGTTRPKAQSTNTGNVDTFVDESRVDRRLNRGNWCNQPGGIGERPRAANIPGIDAFVWVKPPGESDGGSSLELSYDPNDPAKGFDPMCDATYTRAESSGVVGTGALSDAPVAGQWFSKGFQTLLKNAYPPLLAK